MAGSKTETVGERLRWLREQRGYSLRQLRSALNGHLPENQRISFKTLANYETAGTPNEPKPGPRTEILDAIKKQFPEVRTEWLVHGTGHPTIIEQELLGYDTYEELTGTGLRTYQIENWPFIHRLPHLARQHFFRLLVDLYLASSDAGQLAETGKNPPELAKLALDLQTYLLLPFQSLGFRRVPHSDEKELLGDYVIDVLRALSRIIPRGGSEEALKAANFRHLSDQVLQRKVRVIDSLEEESDPTPTVDGEDQITDLRAPPRQAGPLLR